MFGHTRGAFTGAVQSRTGRIEAANGGTLFLDEIGEMPLALQAKMLRFLESGELQRVGENEMVRVDVRVIAATHQHLRERAAERSVSAGPVSPAGGVSGVCAGAEGADGGYAAAGGLSAGEDGGGDAGEAAVGGRDGAADEYDWPGNVRELRMCWSGGRSLRRIEGRLEGRRYGFRACCGCELRLFVQSGVYKERTMFDHMILTSAMSNVRWCSSAALKPLRILICSCLTRAKAVIPICGDLAMASGRPSGSSRRTPDQASVRWGFVARKAARSMNSKRRQYRLAQGQYFTAGTRGILSGILRRRCI